MLDATLGRLEREFVAYCKKHNIEGSVTFHYNGRQVGVSLELTAQVAEIADHHLRTTNFDTTDNPEIEFYNAGMDLGGSNRGTSA